MAEPAQFLDDLFRRLAAIPAVAVAFWGAAGGLTNALVIRVSFREAARHVSLGALIAVGVGTLGGPLLEHWGLIGPGWATTGASDAIAYLTGSLGAAAFEVVLSRIRAGRLPTDKEGV